MRIEEHPFYILGVTPRSSRREILQRAEALGIQSDPECISTARLQLTHPAKRLEAEVRWFPGLPPSRIRQIIKSILQDSDFAENGKEALSGVDCLGRFNALAYWLTAHSNVTPAAWGLALHQLNESLQQIDIDDLTATVNADRSAAGMPQVTDIDAIGNVVAHITESTAADLAESLVQCPRHSEVLNLVVERDTENGEGEASDFIGKFVDRYQILVQPELQRCSARVSACTDRVLSIARVSIAQVSASSNRMDAAIKQLESKLSAWGTVARPIQLVMKSRGLKDAHSIEVARKVRGVAVKLANDFELHEDAQRITTILYEVFDQVPEIAELLEQDFETLDGIINTRARSAGPAQEQQRFDFEDREEEDEQEEYCARCGRPMVETIGPSGTSYACTGPDCPNAKSPERSPEPDTQSAQAARDPSDAFVQLCRSIRLNCWQRVQGDGSHQSENLAAFNAAYGDYQRQVAPWLSILCDTHRGDTPVIMTVRNAAAECLSSIAGGLICVNDLVGAQRLCLEALPLVFDDAKIEAEVKGQLDFIAAEQEKATKAAPRRPHAASTGTKPDRQGATPEAASAQTPVQSRFDGLGTSRYRVPLLVAVGIAVLVAIPFLIHTAKQPQWQPSVSDLTIARPQAASENPPAPEPQSSLSPVPPPPAEYQQVERIPDTVRELKPVPYTAVPAEAPEPAHEPVSLPNGTNIAPALDPEGLGKLRISNYTDHDAAVKLKTVAERTTVRFVYVRAKSDVTLTKITPGDYVLQFATGRDWDSTELRFQQDRGFSAFDKVLSFAERTVEDGTIYSTHSVTLHAVPNGNVRKKAIAAEEFYDDLGSPAKRPGR